MQRRRSLRTVQVGDECSGGFQLGGDGRTERREEKQGKHYGSVHTFSTGPSHPDPAPPSDSPQAPTTRSTQLRPAAEKPDPQGHTALEAEATPEAVFGMAMPHPTCRSLALRGLHQERETIQQSMVPPAGHYVYSILTGRKGVWAHVYILQPTPKVYLKSLHLHLTGRLQATIICTLNDYNGILPVVPISTPAHTYFICHRVERRCSYTSDYTIRLLKTILERCLAFPNNGKKIFLRHLGKD